jgi:hypothetical protein
MVRVFIRQINFRKINFIREGRFAESNEDGLPTLKLVGEIEDLIEQGCQFQQINYIHYSQSLLERLSINDLRYKSVFFMELGFKEIENFTENFIGKKFKFYP